MLGEMKVSLAERMQEVLEAYMQYLDKEKTHFKYELEADNPGITEVIETREFVLISTECSNSKIMNFFLQHFGTILMTEVARNK